MNRLTRKRKKDLGLAELIAVALGGMVGGGIFSILGISVEQVGNATPIAILVGGVLAFFAAYSYVKLAVYYKDEGATYSFFKRTFPHSKFLSSVIGWFVVFGYISTLALYAFTFSSYFCSLIPGLNTSVFQKIVAGSIILIFVVINLVSVKGMGKVEDWLVYTKIIVLLFISGLLAGKGDFDNITPVFSVESSLSAILIVSSITFVAYEGFQLVIHAYNEMDDPKRNVPRAIYGSIIIAALLYAILSVGALASIPHHSLIEGKEYALASGAKQYLGGFGLFIVVFGALLATSSAISGTLFGASRLMAVIAHDGYLPQKLGHKIKVHIPDYAIITMGVLAFILILSDRLEVILEFGSITFIIVSFLMAYSNYKIRKKTNSNALMATITMVSLLGAGILILYFEFTENRIRLLYILGIYMLLMLGAFVYSKKIKSS